MGSVSAVGTSVQGEAMGRTGKVVMSVVGVTGAGSAVAGVAQFGWPILLGGGVAVLLILGWLSWVLSDRARTDRFCMIIYGRKVK